MPETNHGCPGCGTPVSRSLVACRTCWWALPAALRDAINAAWQQRRRTPASTAAIRDHRMALVAALDWYRQRRSGATP